MKNNDEFRISKMTDKIISFDHFDEEPDLFEDYTLTSEDMDQIKIEDEVEYNSRTLDMQVEDALSTFASYKLSVGDTQIVKDLLTFKLQTHNLESWYKNKNAFYNLIISTTDIPYAFEFSIGLAQVLGAKHNGVFTEREGMCMSFYGLEEKFKQHDFITITECCYVPLKSSNIHSSTARSDVDRKNNDYHDFWRSIGTLISTYKDVMVVIISTPKVISRCFKLNHAIFNTFASHHIEIKKMDTNDVITKCISELEEKGYTVTDGFTEKLSDYIKDIYPSSELSYNVFIDNLVNKITENVFKKTRDNMTLLPDMAPTSSKVKKTTEELLQGLDKYVGLSSIKDELQKMYNKFTVFPDTDSKVIRHMCFVGNPGTGKSTVAEEVASIFHSMGILPTDKCIKATAYDYTSVYIGGSVEKMHALIDNAEGGVLFIDEAYALFTDAEEKQDVLSVLLDAATERADSMIIILAGYKKEMEIAFRSNPGLKYRFPKKVVFDDFTCDELIEIFKQLCAKDGLTLMNNAIPALKDVIMAHKAEENFANARTIAHIYNEILEQKITSSSKFTNKITDKDCQRVLKNDVAYSLDNLIGLKDLKENIDKLANMALYIRKLRDSGCTMMADFYMHMLLTGNPGTGKTTVANSLARVLYSIGILKNNKVTMLERKDFIGNVIGGSELKTEQVLGPAYGGLIVIDEAYSLNKEGNDYGRIVIDMLVKAMEEHREDTVFVFAGYPDEMDEFLSANPGLSSRFGFRYKFEDYSTEELTCMYQSKLERQGFDISQEAIDKASSLISYFRPMKHFGNGRFVDTLISQTLTKRSMRDIKTNFKDISVSDIPDIQDMIKILSGPDEMYNPDELTSDSKRRTSIHETGHALIALLNGIPVESISIKSEIGSLGRVCLKADHRDMTEGHCIKLLAMLLGGRNAERIILGDNSAGCSEDYKRANDLATKMSDVYGMGDIGVDNKVMFLKKADQMATELLTKHKELLLKISDELIKGKSFSGDELKKMVDECANGQSDWSEPA